jgi:serine/threonine-protein kinase
VSLWSRIKQSLRPTRADLPDPEPVAPEGEQLLRGLLERLAEGEAAAGQKIGDRDFWGAVERLTSTGRERTAIDLLGRFAAARPDDVALTARLAELLCDRREDAAARPFLERLLNAPHHALRARFLLAEICERAGDEESARRHLEALLAVDLEYPRARAACDRLRGSAAQPPSPVAAPTVAGLPDGGAFAGRYRLVREIGRGASGAVYVAHDAELTRDLALKILHPHARATARAESRARAWMEARVAASIRHPGVVAIYDLDEERQLLAMELCTGGALKDRVHEGPLGDAIPRAIELLTTLEAVHLRGVVHGDVKPGNLLFRSAGGDLVLGDFGIAHLASEKPIGEASGASRGASREAVPSGMPGGSIDDRGARGTLAYMSPEQRKGELVPAADVWAAGVILVEMLSGTAALAPWLADRGALLRGTARWDGSLPASVSSELGPRAAELRDFIASLLAVDATKRPSAGEAARALAGFLQPL